MSQVGATRIDELRTVPLFADLDGDVLARLAASATEVTVPRGHVLVQPRAQAAGVFVLQEGSVVVEMPGRRTIELGPGEIFGELALLVPDAVRSARVYAKTAVRCLAVDRRTFTELLEAEPRIAVPMLRVLARRLMDATAR